MYVKVSQSKKKIRIKLTPEGIDFVRKSLPSNNPHLIIKDLLKGKGLEYFSPEELGFPVLSNAVQRNDQGEVRKISAVYVPSENLDCLFTNGKIDFELAE